LHLADRRELNQGFGNALSKAIELVLTPAIFGALGWWIDGRLGTSPLFMLILGVSTFAYESWRMLYAYNEAMAEREASAPWSRSPEADRAA
jgi:F0F1-type ATP synthase assembly protein I